MENVEVPLHVAQTSEDFDEVQKSLQKYLPESSMIYGFLLARKSYKSNIKEVEKKILYSPHSSLVVATPGFSQKGIQSLSVFWDIYLEEEHTIVKLLKSICNFDWTQPVFFYGTPIVVLEKLQTLASKGLLGNGLLTPHTLFSSHFYSLTSQPELEQSLPEGLELRVLDEEHSGFIHDHWEYKFSETIGSYKCYLKVFPGVGVFRTIGRCNDLRDNQRSNKHQQARGRDYLSSEANDSLNTPVAWSHISPYNVFTNTYTLPEYRGKKLALAVTIALAKISIQKTGFASACIDIGNHASIKLHEKAGFIKQHTLGYQYFKSSVSTCLFDSLEPFA